MLKGIIEKIRMKSRVLRWKHSKPDEIFTEIHSRRLWGDKETTSGPGSMLAYCKQLQFYFPHLLDAYDIQRVTDLACGDFNWMKEMDLSKLDYLGYDIVEELVEHNTKKYGATHVRFEKKDITSEPIRSSDLLICRDVLVHLNFKQIQNVLKQIKKSNSGYLLATTFPFESNRNRVTGTWAPLNLQAAPFHLSTPLLLLNEYPFLNEATLPQRFIGLWKL
jgi:2-polyprenyl-3-methyl-5-hydroxy-6-metoxy-1,4-benzoquinol methylase